ncbi:MAG: hypothetical protein RIC19_15425 [Phaeodactylibacter sp.]|uniref:hypothetical protein n=1 Tax=Phaeodactylibacter sp. TaxID=1940289 RepID=UPI0032EAC40F
MIKNALITFLVLGVACSCYSSLSAQSVSPWSFGGSLQAGVGSSAYTDHPHLASNRDFGMVWHSSIDVNTWYQLTPRLSFGGGVGIRAQYFQLQTYSTIPELATDIGFVLQSSEEDYYLDRVKHNGYMTTLNVHTEYLTKPYGTPGFNLAFHAGARMGMTPISQVRTLYGERDYGAKDFLPEWGTSHLFEGIASADAIEGYFDGHMNKSLLFFQVGLVAYHTSMRTGQSVRVALVYEGTTEALSQGFNSPLQGISISMGARLNR